MEVALIRASTRRLSWCCCLTGLPPGAHAFGCARMTRRVRFLPMEPVVILATAGKRRRLARMEQSDCRPRHRMHPWSLHTTTDSLNKSQRNPAE